MKINRICFIAGLAVLLLNAGSYVAAGQRLSRDLDMDLLVNHAGYVPEAGKLLVTKGNRTGKFEVVNTATQEVVFTGFFKPGSGDFGEYSTGDFSPVKKEGNYYVKSDTLRSYPFSISRSVYKPAMDLILGYFSLQRCGASSTGFMSPCHLDDGVRIDNGKHQDVTGGWHDASDLRKWVDATIYGMIGLAKTYDLSGKNLPDREKLLEEMKWGNIYFLKMQEPQGYVMNFIGGGMNENNDNNRWTDNEIGPDGGEMVFTKPNAGRSGQNISILGTKDDRVIQTKPVNMVGQYNFITSEAMMARFTKTGDPEYSRKCLKAAISCFEWCEKNNKSTSPTVIGGSMQAALELYKVTGSKVYKDFAFEKAAQLYKQQADIKGGGASGFFYTSPDKKAPFKSKISDGCLEFISLCDLVNMFPESSDAVIWKKMISEYADKYLVYFSKKNSFGIIPYGLFTGKDPGGNRRSGEFWYRYFMQPELSWWVGINANIASAGIGLIKASGVLDDPDLKRVAQKQLDWIIGVNPFNSSTIVYVGNNQPVQFVPGSFKPSTPLLPGGVMNGLVGDSNDQPNLLTKSNYEQSEYWTPMVAYTLWLMAEITAGN